MNKIAEFLVKRRRVVTVAVLLLTVVCGLLALRVPINKDRTKYLADDSNMKQGIAVMNDSFPEAEEKSSIRVMFDDLTESDIYEVLDRLRAIPDVSSVTFEKGSEKYNKDNHTLFVVNSTYDYKTDEERAIETAIDKGFPEYTMEYQNNDMPETEVPLWLILTALALALIILVLMSPSWLDPVLFLATIGIAIIINYGTNIVLPYTDEMTATVGPVLQLVLSMDYSIILMTRYRQEKLLHSDREEAMKAALAGSISSISSSSLTTVVGLLALVFLSFKLGPELGIVLSKGVFVSMLCVFTVLPGMILRSDKWLEKAKKGSLHIPMGGITAFSYRLRYVMPVLFAALLVGSYFLQNATDIEFTEGSEDRVAAVFQKDNTAVVIYRNEDEEKAAGVIAELEKDPRIESVMGYSNTLNKKMNADEMSDAIVELSKDSVIDGDIVRLLYYVYKDGELPAVTVSDFLTFITDTVLPNKMLSGRMDEGITDNVDYLKKFSDKENLKRRMTAGEMASFFGIEEKSVKDLYLLYYMQHGVPDSGTMTLQEFTDYVLNTVANDATYGAMFDAATLASLRQLQTFTDVNGVQQGRTAADLASVMGIDEGLVETVYRLYYAGDVSGRTMTISEFSSFLCDSMMQDALFSSYFDDTTRAQVQTLNTLIRYAVSGQALTAGEMAQVLGMDENSVAGLYYLYYSDDPAFMAEAAAMTMSLPDALSLMQQNATGAQAAELAVLEPLITAAAAGRRVTNGVGDAITGMTESLLGGLFGLEPDEVTTLPELYASAVESFPEDSGLRRRNTIVQLAATGEKVDAATIADLFEIDSQQVVQLFGLALASQKTMTVPAFTGFLVNSVLTDEAYAGNFTAEQAAQLRQMDSIVQLAVSGTPMSTSALSQAFGMEESLITTVFKLCFGAGVSGKTMSLDAFSSYILSDATMSGRMDETSLGQLRMLRSIIEASSTRTRYSSQGLAGLLGMDAAQAEQLYILRMSDTADWKLSPYKFISFAAEDVLENPQYSQYVDKSSAADLKKAQALTEAVIYGREYTVDEMAGLLGALTDDLSAKELEVLYLYYGGVKDTDLTTVMTIPELFTFLSDDLLNDSRFKDFFDEATREEVRTNEAKVMDAIAQMKGDEYARLVITSDYPDESPETESYIQNLKALCEDNFGEYYMIGNSVMVSEMSEAFDREYIIITLITAVAIFCVVLLTFRNLFFPLILTLVVQCGVFITVTVIGAYAGGIYYLALLIVQSILMGATIDYGIVFCNFYRENRKTMAAGEALKAAYDGSIHTIMTSGSILVLVLASLGIYAPSVMISEVCVTLSIGAFVALMLILFVLPGLVACCDRFNRPRRSESSAL